MSLSFGISSLAATVAASINGTCINTEVNTQLDLAHAKIGSYEAMLDWVNKNVHTMPFICGGHSKIHYKDERSQYKIKEQDNNLTLWVLTLDVLAFNGYLNAGVLSKTFLNWSSNESAGIDEALSIELAKQYIAALVKLDKIQTNTKAQDVHNEQGEARTIQVRPMTPEFVQELANLIPKLRERAHMVCKPMTHTPEDWVNAVCGVGENAGLQLITRSKLKHDEVAPKVLTAVNKLQKVRFTVSPACIAAAKDMITNRHLFVKAGALHDTVTDKEVTDEAFKLYEEILKYQSEDGYCFPVTMDTRGRMYYRGGILSPQGVDFCKAAFQFTEAKPLGVDGFKALCIHTANVFGKDKMSLEDRVKWVQCNLSEICEFKTHRQIRTYFADASVFQALVAADEIRKIVAHTANQQLAQDFMSTLVCHQDGTCNGLQHMAAITGDRATAEAVNCVKSSGKDAPADVYGLVAIEATNHTTDGTSLLLMKRFGRDMAKNPVMVTSYGATAGTIQKNIASYLLKNKAGSGSAKTISKAYLAAIGTKAGAVTQLTTALKVCVNLALMDDDTKTTFNWMTADGFEAATCYKEVEGLRIRAGILAARMQGNTTLDKIKTAGAMAPNFIHSIDATHLRMIVNGCDHDLVTVHDSIGSHACDYSNTSKMIREKFVLVHTCFDALDNLCANMDQAAPEFTGDYSAKEALESAYIFS